MKRKIYILFCIKNNQSNTLSNKEIYQLINQIFGQKWPCRMEWLMLPKRFLQCPKNFLAISACDSRYAPSARLVIFFIMNGLSNSWAHKDNKSSWGNIRQQKTVVLFIRIQASPLSGLCVHTHKHTPQYCGTRSTSGRLEKCNARSSSLGSLCLPCAALTPGIPRPPHTPPPDKQTIFSHNPPPSFLSSSWMVASWRISSKELTHGTCVHGQSETLIYKIQEVDVKRDCNNKNKHCDYKILWRSFSVSGWLFSV